MVCFFSNAGLVYWSKVGPETAVPHNRRWFQESDRKICIYGAGQAGMMVQKSLASIPGVAERILAFFDSNPGLHGVAINGTPVVSPDDPQALAANPLVIVATDNREWLLEMEERCRSLGYDTVRYGVTTAFGKARLVPEEIERSADAVAALDIWADGESRRTYRALVRLHATWDFSDIHEIHTPGQYFQPFLPQGCHRAFVDGGAFNGDTLKEFLERFGDDFDAYYAFEPDAANFGSLVRSIGENRELRDKRRIRCWQKGLYSRNATLRFRAESDMGSSVDEAGELVIEAVALDDALGDAPATFIKLDIEGSEPEALRGMRGIISRQAPVVAVCVYHASEHLWEIPLWLKRNCPGYRLYLRHHSMHEWESVCYAVPAGARSGRA